MLLIPATRTDSEPELGLYNIIAIVLSYDDRTFPLAPITALQFGSFAPIFSQLFLAT